MNNFELKDKIKNLILDFLEKSASHKYIRREGTPGNYTYYYKEPDGSERSSKEPLGESEGSESQASSGSSVRDEAAQDFKNNMNSNEYNFARESKFSNMGEDLVNSARHKRNMYSSLKEAEEAGEGGIYLEKKNLLKSNPIDLFAGLEKNNNPICQVQIYYTIQKYPEMPDLARYSRLTDEDKKEIRLNYFNFYNELKLDFENLSSMHFFKDSAPIDVGVSMREKILKKMTDMRKNHGKSMNHMILYNSFVKYYNGLAATNKNSAYNKALEFKTNTKDLDQSSIIEKAKDLIEGKKLKFENENKKEKIKKFDPSYLYVEGKVERKGPEYNLDNVKKQENYILDKTQMRGVQWGNSVTDDEREHHLNNIAYAFKDLTDILDLPEEMGSFNGKLGLAVGARGYGRALAHYEPELKVINLTRKKGVGSLSHEWGHFFDNTIYKMATERNHEDYFSSYVNVFLSNGAVKDGAKPIFDVYKKLNAKLEKIRDRVRQHMREDKSQLYDEKYWSSREEVFARCFENYVNHKLENNGRKNTYLTKGVDHPLWPTSEESKDLAPLFDDVFSTFKKSPFLTKSFLNSI